ncbi:MAG: 30S ribosomal protein S3ae [Candidatus Bathyarchaeota archaeon]|nr:MAG: 30S ribosomal protein S3ae [Candidatus Bathyarchaeota archaeon]
MRNLFSSYERFIVSSKKKRRVRDKWRDKKWYTVISPPYFGGVELGTLPTENSSKLVGRIVDATLYDVTEDYTHQYLKMFFRITDVEGKIAHTIFKGHEYSQDYLRSLVRRRTTRVDGIFNVTTKDSYQMRLAVCAFTLSRIKTSQERVIRSIVRRIIEGKATTLTFDEFAQEVVLGKIASDIYNEAKKIAPLRHVGVRKSKLTLQPTVAA